MYYEIIRLDNQQADQETFREVKRLVKRGRLHKAINYLAQWDYGPENIGPARYLERIWETPTDGREKTDQEIKVTRDGRYHLCMADPTRNGGYEAYYLTSPLSEETN